MNPKFQEEFNRFRQEDPVKYLTWVAQVNVYTTLRRNAFILGFLEGTELTVVGRAEGYLPEGFSVANVKTLEDKLSYINRAKIAITAFPAFIPSGIGFTPLEIAACETAPMVNFRSTLPGFLKPQEEVIAYNPLDRMDIEEKLLFYLENDEDRQIIAENAYKAVKERFTCHDRINFIKELMANVMEQIAQQKQAEEGGNPTPPS
jgi:spore maturation protein CgeB